MNNNSTDVNQEQQMLSLIMKFGFIFYGYDESASMLVKAPNGQVVGVKLAYEFIQKQIAQQSSSSGPESMPDIPQMPDSKPAVESSFEKEISIENVVESKDQDSDDDGSAQQPPSTQQSTPQAQPQPQVNLKQAVELPYQAGFDPRSFDPRDVDSTLAFIKQNSKASNTSSDKWLALLFEKFLNELQQGNI